LKFKFFLSFCVHDTDILLLVIPIDDEDIKALFTDVESKELTEDRTGIPSISRDIAKELTKYGRIL
jgi:hypothetical protein